MSGPKDGGPVHPGFTEGLAEGWFSGLSLRDWFAGQALASMVTVRDVIHALNGGDPDHPFERNLGEAAYRIADAMLAERERQP